ncbi:hypothetical protein WAI61_18715, partial [Acinetobacter baumannii]
RKLDCFQILKPLLPSLFMGLMTTLVAYIFLSFTPFPGFKQIAVFSIVGLTAAWISSVLLLPRLPALNAQPAIQALSWIGQARLWFQQRTKVRSGLIAIILAVGTSSLFYLKSNDDIRNLQGMDASLKLQDQAVREQFGQQQSSDYFVVRAASANEMQQQEQQLIGQLQQLQTNGKISAFQALGQWVPPLAEQQNNLQLLRNIPKATLQQYAQSMGLNVTDVLQWQQQLAAQPLLDFSVFKDHPLAFLQPQANERLVMVTGVKQPDALKQLQNEHIHFQQPITAMSQMFAEHRVQAQHLLIYALIGLAVGLALIYGLSSIVPLVLPVSLALLSTFAV